MAKVAAEAMRRYTRGLPPSAAPQPSALARDLAELSQRSASGAEASARTASPEATPRGGPLQLEHWRLLEGGEALPVCRDSVRLSCACDHQVPDCQAFRVGRIGATLSKAIPQEGPVHLAAAAL